MKVLFVSSGNSQKFKIAPFIKAQGESLKQAGVDLHYFTVEGKGIAGYIKSGRKLRALLKEQPFDLVHAHFTLSGWAALIGAFPQTPVVLSLMGTDAQGDYVGTGKVKLKSRLYQVLTQLIQPFVQAIISKSANIEEHVYYKSKSHVIPNGIDTSIFKPNREVSRQSLGLDPDKQYVLFLGDKNKPVKNFALAQEAVHLLGRDDVELINPYPLAHLSIPDYLNAVDVLVVPSYMEGSPNVVKEAMACNCPIVATQVGDIAWVLGDTPGCHTAGFAAAEFAAAIEKSLAFARQHGRTTGADRIQELKLGSEQIADRLLLLYRSLIKPALLSQPKPKLEQAMHS